MCTSSKNAPKMISHSNLRDHVWYSGCGGHIHTMTVTSCVVRVGKARRLFWYWHLKTAWLSLEPGCFLLWVRVGLVFILLLLFHPLTCCTLATAQRQSRTLTKPSIVCFARFVKVAVRPHCTAGPRLSRARLRPTSKDCPQASLIFADGPISKVYTSLYLKPLFHFAGSGRRQRSPHVGGARQWEIVCHVAKGSSAPGCLQAGAVAPHRGAESSDSVQSGHSGSEDGDVGGAPRHGPEWGPWTACCSQRSVPRS